MVHTTSPMFKNIFNRIIFPVSFSAVFILLFTATYAEDVVAVKGWQWKVYQTGLPRVDNLLLSPTGTMYATLELGGGKGKLVAIRNGKITVLLQNLNRPDGLAIYDNYLFVTEEIEQGRILQFDLRTGLSKIRALLDNPEGIIVLPDGSLLISEDRSEGRLVHVAPSGEMSVILNDLARPEGLRQGDDGTVYIAETGKNRVLAYKNGKIRIIVDSLREPDQLAIDSHGALWIAEDADPGRIFRFGDNKLELMIRGLASPQGMVFDRHGRLFVAEQGKNRILQFFFQSDK